jgi:hypothetical protein
LIHIANDNEVLNMAWDDWVFGIATGGLYNLGKTAYKAGKAADQAGDAVEEIADSVGETVSIMGETFLELADELNSFINELEDLLTTERVTPRNEDDLWDEEVARLNALRQRQAELIAEIEAFGDISTPTSWWEWLSFDWSEYKEYLAVLAKLNAVNNAIKEILYQEPGVVPTAIYEFKEVLERFNTLEQPRIEAIMDATEDSVEEFQEILVEVKKLFVVTRWKQVGDLSIAAQKRVEQLEAAKSVYDTLIAKNTLIAEQLRGPLVRVHPEDLILPQSTAGIWVPEEAPQIKETVSGTVADLSADARVAKVTPTGAGREYVAIPGGIGAGKAAVVEAALPEIARKGILLASRPMAEKVGSVLKTPEINAYLGSHNTVIGRIRFLERERLKIEKEIFQITWVKVEEPGVIPKTLDEVQQSIHRFRTEEQPRLEVTIDSVNTALIRFNTEEQPRIEAIMDNVNGTILESKALLENVNESLDKSQGWLDFITTYRMPILIVCGVAGGLVFAIMIALLVVLIKLAIVL